MLKDFTASYPELEIRLESNNELPSLSVEKASLDLALFDLLTLVKHKGEGRPVIRACVSQDEQLGSIIKFVFTQKDEQLWSSEGLIEFYGLLLKEEGWHASIRFLRAYVVVQNHRGLMAWLYESQKCIGLEIKLPLTLKDRQVIKKQESVEVLMSVFAKWDAMRV